MPAPRKKRLSLAQMFTLGLAAFGGAKANNRRVVPYAHVNRKSTGLATVNTRNLVHQTIKRRIPNSIKLAVKTQFGQMGNASKRERNFLGNNVVYKVDNKSNFIPTKKNTLVNVQRRMGIIGSTKGKATNILKSQRELSNKNPNNLTTQTLTHIKNARKNVNIQKSIEEETNRLKNLQIKENTKTQKFLKRESENLKKLVNNRIVPVISNLKSSNAKVQQMINSTSVHIKNNFITDEIACVENILVLPSIENITNLATVLNDENVPLSRASLLALGGIQENIKTLQINYNKAQNAIKMRKNESENTLKSQLNQSIKFIETRITNATAGSLDAIVQAKITKDDLKLTKDDIIILQHKLNGTLTNKIKKAYLYPGAVYRNKNGNSLLLSIFYSILRDVISPSKLKNKLGKIIWTLIMSFPKDASFITNVFLVLFKIAVPLSIKVLLKTKSLKIVISAIILTVTVTLVAIVKNISVETFVQQIISMAEVLSIYQ